MTKDWNDSGFPIAYLLTFRCYGTWLHGDQRGSIDRDHSVFGTPYAEENERLYEYKKALLTRAPVSLNAAMRSCIEQAIRSCTELRGWTLIAINVRTNHAHVVVAVDDARPENVLTAIKANSTRALREANLWESDRSPWSKGGSKRYLWNEDAVRRACDYVINGQGKPLSDYF